MFRRILVAFDGSAGGWQALRRGVQLARAHQSSLWIAAVAEPLPPYARATTAGPTTASARDLAQRRLDEALEWVAAQGMAARGEVIHGHAARALVEYAGLIGADLVVIGPRGHSGVLHRVLGSTTDRVVDTTPCSVLVARSRSAGD